MKKRSKILIDLINDKIDVKKSISNFISFVRRYRK